MSLQQYELNALQDKAAKLGLPWIEEALLVQGWRPGRPKGGPACPYCKQPVWEGLKASKSPWVHPGCVRPWQRHNGEKADRERLLRALKQARDQLVYRERMVTVAWGPLCVSWGLDLESGWWQERGREAWQEAVDEEHRRHWALAQLYLERYEQAARLVDELVAKAGL